MIQLNFKSQTNAESRIETMDGKTYEVFPSISIVEGVLNGLKYPAEDIENCPPAWNGKPVTMGHPEIDGEPISANTKEAIEQFAYGTIMNSYAERLDDGRMALFNEFWMDSNKCETNAIAKSCLEIMRMDGVNMEVSSGLYVDYVWEEGKYIMPNGEIREYAGKAVNFRPDHIAILPNQTGACSIADGCGIRSKSDQIVYRNEMMKNIKEKITTFIEGLVNEIGESQETDSGEQPGVNSTSVSETKETISMSENTETKAPEANSGVTISAEEFAQFEALKKAESVKLEELKQKVINLSDAFTTEFVSDLSVNKLEAILKAHESKEEVKENEKEDNSDSESNDTSEDNAEDGADTAEEGKEENTEEVTPNYAGQSGSKPNTSKVSGPPSIIKNRDNFADIVKKYGGSN